MRQLEDETILVVANLSRYPQYVELDLGKWKGMRPVELFGHTEFPPIGELPYLLTLGGHAFHWFSIEPPPSTTAADLAAAYQPPTITCASAESLLFGEDRVALEDALPAFLDTRHWFAGRAFRVSAIRIEEAVALGGAYLLIARVEYADRDPDEYVIPVAVVERHRGRRGPPAAAAGDGGLAEVRQRRRRPGRCHGGRWRRARDPGRHRREAARQRPARRRRGDPLHRAGRPRQAEPTNISAAHAAAAIRYGDRYLLKMFRRWRRG